ncbi:MAG: hypothetical protein U0835_01855 [Isosphaeraceae bacterium]
MARKTWYDSSAAGMVRVVPREGSGETLYASRRRHPRVAPGLFECLIYPLTDGPGVGILIFWPPLLFLLSLPIFDVVALLEPLSRGDFALGLLAVPIFSPLMITFSLVLGYGLLFLGHLFVASAMGEPEHPRWPEWDTGQISEGLGRWIWAALFGLAVGGAPVAVYWLYCGDIDWFDRMIFADLVILGVGYALMALAASLLHDNILMANPVTVLSAIFQTGWDYVMPCVAGGFTVLLCAGMMWAITSYIPTLKLAALALLGFWGLSLYLAMVVLRMLGLTYHAHALELDWFRGRPKWGIPARFGRIYSNS